MSAPAAALLSDGKRLHLQHGPIDLIIGAEGARECAFDAARKRFATILDELVKELPLLREKMKKDRAKPRGETALRMDNATRTFASDSYITPMAAVAGAVADTVLASMVRTADLSKAYVNNGGDIAIHLTAGQKFTMAMAGHDCSDLGRIEIGSSDGIGGVATSGRHGRSLSLGIADSVTVVAKTAAAADSAATLIANAVDLPGHPAVQRAPACEIDENSDLGTVPVVRACGPLADRDVEAALSRGEACAADYVSRGLIAGASLHLQGQTRVTSGRQLTLFEERRTYA